MQQAVSIASAGIYSSFPNPSVGCIYVSNLDNKQKVLGRGFHPKAGLGHGEVFALLDASGKFTNSGAEEAGGIAKIGT